MASEVSFSDRASEAWGSFKEGANGFVESQNFDKLLMALIVIGGIGAVAAAVGASGVAAQAGAVSDPTRLLNSLGNGAIGIMVAGGALTILGVICLAILIKRVKQAEIRAEEQKKKAAELERQVKISTAAKNAREASLEFLPEWLRDEARTLEVGHYRLYEPEYLNVKFVNTPKNTSFFESIFAEKEKPVRRYVVLYADQIAINYEIVPESQLAARLAYYKANYRV